ncbi:RNA polymerase sigma-70 factor (ECF subfamily) [Nocardia transvalensis]|uniref:RNA polymerase sigma-70 factor (ECF subfamily) n=1 Tax=Nocardia transvalensis TaxID=37333 RepID=A0A7W9UKF7_9NOCA|nr:ECF RNA polymerase sigma factor SigK [Nocardia transvalensis]MBB5916262.1 RNA polymerase sigma-70 factor (ECF subfamily) [Nocardia transvalensis]
MDAILHALIERVAVGDEQAFAELYDLVSGPVLGVVTRILRDRSRSEEVTQEVMLEIWLKAPKYCRQPGNVMAWAVTMAHRRAIDRVRHEQASADREDRIEQLDVRRPVDEVVETALARLDTELVRTALDRLTELQRQSIVLAYYGGYTYREVSQVLDTPVGTVKTRMRDGLIRLREYLGAHQ